MAMFGLFSGYALHVRNSRLLRVRESSPDLQVELSSFERESGVTHLSVLYVVKSQRVEAHGLRVMREDFDEPLPG